MEMLIIIMMSVFLMRFPKVNGEYSYSNNFIQKDDRHTGSKEFTIYKAMAHKENDEKLGVERIGQEISILRSQMRSMLQMVELQAVLLQTFKDQTIPNSILQFDTRLKDHMLDERRYWRKIRKEVRRIYKCSCHPGSSTESNTKVEVEKEVLGNFAAENRIFSEINEKDVDRSSNGGSSGDDEHVIDEDNSSSSRNSSIQNVRKRLGSSNVIELPGSTKILENKIRNNATLSLKDMPSLDDNLESYDVEIDLTTGIVHGKSTAGLTWLLHPSLPKKRKSNLLSECRLQSVMKLSFSPPTKKNEDLKSQKDTRPKRRKLLIDLWLQKPHNWIFNLGDSSSNDGLSGDGSTQQNDCEAEGHGDTFTVYKSDKVEDPFDKIAYRKKGFLKHRVTFIVSDQSLFWNNHNGNTNILNDTTLFALNEQPDSQGPVNSDIYLALNRVISGNYRNGHGLCKASLKWLS